jgi:glycosyltransferase involved in cell wall biosynthesis
VLRHLRDHTDAFVHPTLEESFGSSILEAMSQRLPVIAGEDSGAVPWILDDGRVGMLVDVTSPESLCSGMERVMTDAVLRERYAQEGFDRAASSFTLATVAERYLSVLGDVQSGRDTAAVSTLQCPL